MTAFPADTQPTGTTVGGAEGPTGAVNFSPSLDHETVGNGWETWSNGYAGDVYAAGNQSITMTLPKLTKAFYFYAEPDQFETFSMVATTNDGATSGPIDVDGFSGARYFGFYATGSHDLKTITVTGADPDGFAVGEFGISSCAAYQTPADWNTASAQTITPGVEPLNVIISACSTVSLGDIQGAMSDEEGWDTATFLGVTPCISPENANVSGSGYVPQEEAWRLDGCYIGNVESLDGTEDHIRFWNQPVTGTRYGAWFATASLETACAQPPGATDLVPVQSIPSALYHKFTGILWHCIDGGTNADGTPTSLGSNGYDLGAATFVSDLQAVASEEDWSVTTTVDPRPSGTGQGGVAFSGSVTVVTVQFAPDSATSGGGGGL